MSQQVGAMLKKRRKNYSAEMYERAITWAITGSATLATISRETGVPYQTIKDHITGLHQRGKEGTQKLFTDKEEEAIKRFIFMRADLHWPLKQGELMDCIGDWMQTDARHFKLGKKQRPGK